MLLASLLLAALVVHAPAQAKGSAPQEAEATSAGRVVGVDGQPVVGAQVTFLSRPLPRSYTAGTADRRTAKTDDRGRYRLKLSKDRRYTAWATWAQGASGLVEGVTGGEFLEFRGLPETGPFRLKLDGLADWPQPEQYSVRLLVGGQNIDFVTAKREGDVFHVPSMPSYSSRPFQVLDKAGVVRWAYSLGPWDDEAVTELPELRDWKIEVVDANDKPVAGAAIRWHILNYWYSRAETLPAGQRFQSLWPIIGTTNAAGKATIALPAKDGRIGVWLLTAKDGYRMSQDGAKNGRMIRDGKDIGEWESEDFSLRIVLQKSEPVVLDLRGPDRIAPVDGWLQLGLRVNIKINRGGMGTILTQSVPVKDGKVQFLAPLPPGTEVELVEAALADGLRSRWRQDHGVAPRVWRSTGPGGLLEGNVGEDPLGLLNVTPVQVTAVDGRPAARVAVMMKQRSRGVIGVRTDRIGKALLPGPARDGRLVVAADDQGFVVGRTTADGEAMALQLEPFGKVAVRVVDEQGVPVAGVLVGVSKCGLDDDNEDLQWGLGVVLPNRTWVRSDAKGRLQLPVPPMPCRVWLRTSRRIDSGNVVPVAADGKPAAEHTVVVQSPR